MPFNDCVLRSCLFNHGGEEGHPLRIGGMTQMKEYTLQVDHLEQETFLSIRLMPRIDSGSRGENHGEAQHHCEPDQSEPSDEAG